MVVPTNPPAPDAILAWRRERELSAAQAAALVDVTPHSWLQWEAGEQPMQPRLWELVQLKDRPLRPWKGPSHPVYLPRGLLLIEKPQAEQADPSKPRKRR